MPTHHKQRIIVVGHAVGSVVFGAERSLLDILAAVDRDRFELTCVLPDTHPDYQAAAARYTSDIVVFPYAWWNKARPVAPETVSKFESLFRDRGADLVHVNTITLLDPLVAARRLQVPTLVHARELIDQDPDLAGYFAEDPAMIVATMLDAADYILANSDITHALYRKPGKSFRLYDCVDVNGFDLPNPLEHGQLKIGIISSNLPKKGIDAFAELAGRAARRSSALEFFVFGPRTRVIDRLWPLTDDQKPETSGAQGAPHANLHLAGYVANSVDAIRALNLVVSFSEVPESFGRTMAEAMAARRPVVAYNHGAAGELIRHGQDGFLVSYHDIVGALAHLLMLADNPDRVREMGESGRARAVELFSPSVFAAQLNAIYGNILGAEKRNRE